MIVVSQGSTEIRVCESTANCSIVSPAETSMEIVLETVDKNNYICQIVYCEDLEVAKKFAYYAGGVATNDKTVLLNIENDFE